MELLPDKPRSMGVIFQLAAALYVKNIKNTWPWALGIGVLILLFNWIALDVASVAVLVVLGLLFAGLATYFIVIMLHQHYFVAMEEAPSMVESMDFALAKLLSTAISMWLYGALITVGCLLWVIPGIVVGFFLMLFLPLQLFAEFGVLRAFKNSFSLLWGNWWRSFFVLIIPAFLLLVLTMAVRYSGLDLSVTLIYLCDVAIISLLLPFVLALLVLYTNDLIVRTRQHEALKEFKHYLKTLEDQD